MAYPAYIREKARQLRQQKALTIDELAERLALSRTTIYYWVRDLPIPRTEGQSLAQRRASRANKQRYSRLRKEAYEEGRQTFAQLSLDPTFRDFVILYLTEGYKRSRNQVAVANSDPALIGLAASWINQLTRNTVAYSIQYHADQNLRELRSFWGAELAVDPASIRLQRKSNSNGLAGRTWRSRYGVLTVSCGDTYLRARLQAWIDCLKEQWLDSARNGV
jgi:transcriptional regulator with XRE-family HTH domain